MAQTMCDDGQGFIDRPAAGHGISSNMGPRDTGIPGASKNHKGTDYLTPCGTKIGGPPEGCVNMNGGAKTPQNGGYGYAAHFDCGNGIKIKYSHLQNANSYNPASNTITTGNSGVGGCHLDYIIEVNGTVVDAQCATGLVTGDHTYGNSSTKHGKQCPFSGAVNLCDSNVQNELRQHSNDVFNNSGANNYNVPEGSTQNQGPAENSENTDTGTQVINQGTQGKDGTGGVNSNGNPYEVPEETGSPAEEQPPEQADGGEGYQDSGSQPRCDNSTCITRETIDIAKNKKTEYDKAESYKDYLSSEGECQPPIKTGADVFHQEIGKYRKYPDSFCTNRGCVYENTSEGGDGKCQ